MAECDSFMNSRNDIPQTLLLNGKYQTRNKEKLRGWDKSSHLDRIKLDMLVRYPSSWHIDSLNISISHYVYTKVRKRIAQNVCVCIYIYINIKGYEMLWSHAHLFKIIWLKEAEQ